MGSWGKTPPAIKSFETNEYSWSRKINQIGRQNSDVWHRRCGVQIDIITNLAVVDRRQEETGWRRLSCSIDEADGGDS